MQKNLSHFKDLIELYKIPTHTDSTEIKKKMAEYIPDYEWTFDSAGNMYGSHPDSTSKVVLSSHLDMVHTGKDLKYVINSNGCLFGVDKDFSPTSLGADDKNGLWCIIQASKHKSKPHIVLFDKEECGRVGSQACNREWFEDKDCCIVIDRKGERQIIAGGIRGEYTSLLGPMFKQINPDWKFESGMSCDADSIKDIIDVINISCGYYEAHTRDEYTILSELEETLSAILKFLDVDTSYLPWDAIKEYHKYKFKNNVQVKKCIQNTEDNEDLTYEEWVRSLAV